MFEFADFGLMLLRYHAMWWLFCLAVMRTPINLKSHSELGRCRAAQVVREGKLGGCRTCFSQQHASRRATAFAQAKVTSASIPASQWHNTTFRYVRCVHCVPQRFRYTHGATLVVGSKQEKSA